MRNVHFGRTLSVSAGVGRQIAGGLLVVGLLAGCGGTTAAAPYGMTPSVAYHAPHTGSWMLPAAKSDDLLYVTAAATGVVYVYTYPQRQSVGMLSGLQRPGGECVDPAGDVFITTRNSTTGTIYEYAHGASTPMATLSDPDPPSGCAIDPATGNLAVANYGAGTGKGGGSVAIYTDAQGTPTMYEGGKSFDSFFSCSYDDQSKLFLSSQYVNVHKFVRLDERSGTFHVINVRANIGYGVRGGWNASVQWDGKYMTLSAYLNTPTVKLYRLEISKNHATVVSTTKMEFPKRTFHEGQSWIQGSTVIGNGWDDASSKVTFWAYPKGGNGHASIVIAGTHNKTELDGVTVSVAP